MSDIGEQINFKVLFRRHGQIRIPMIQRDYAQGRPSQEEVREEFLRALEHALRLPAGDPSLPLNLDFIYGSVERGTVSRFAPLDGQQRLTTLFFLHWYLAWVDDCLEAFRELFQADGHSRFSYRVRPSSGEFFDGLVEYSPEVRPGDVTLLSAWIKDQPWYFRNWRLDPTIQSSLVMLDAIHARFSTSSGLFERLTCEEQPSITFQLLDLEDFGLSDDLYIKMNARGKPLTPFETFKARYEQVLASQFSGETRKIGDQAFPVAEFVARQLDTRWADLFWARRDRTTNLYDEVVMNVFRTIALISRSPDSGEYALDAGKLRSQSVPPGYSTFQNSGWLDRGFTEILISLLETWTSSRGFSNLPSGRYFDEKTAFERLTLGPAKLSMTELLLAAGYCLFIQKHETDLDQQAFEEWMRVVHNLAVNSYIERADELRNTARGLRELLVHSTGILEFMSQLGEKDRISGFLDLQVKEESLKAALILAHDGWRPLLEKAERHGYFKGQIDFLLDFSGVWKAWRADNGCAWDAATHLRLQSHFIAYLGKAEAMFHAHGLANLGAFRWQRALLSLGDYLLTTSRNKSFLVSGATDTMSWKRLLRGTGAGVIEKRTLLKELWDRLDLAQPVTDQLDAIIKGAKGLEPWKDALVRTPDALEYCGNGFIRLESTSVVYLLKKSQMNGSHAELYTFCLHHNLLEPMERQRRMRPMALHSYFYVSGTDLMPHARLGFTSGGKDFCVSILPSGFDFRIAIQRRSFEGHDDLRETLRDQGNFAETEQELSRICNPDEIETALVNLAELVASAP